jgi:hypothetical protein
MTLYNVQVMLIGINKLKRNSHKTDDEILQKMSPYRKTHIVRLRLYVLIWKS